MKKGMTSRTNNHKIRSIIVFPIFVFMVYSKNIRAFFIATNFALLYPAPFFISPSDIGKTAISCGFSLIFTTALYRTKRIIFAGRTHKTLTTVFAFILPTPSSFLGTMITQAGAIFCFIASRRDMFKSSTANSTNSFNLFCAPKFIFAFTRTILCRSKAIYRNVKFIAATETIYKFTSMRFRHATP